MQNETVVEVLIIGGGPAGLSCGLSLGRMSRTALICDDGRPRNAASSHANNFATRDGVHPAKWRELAREDLSKYKTVSLRNTGVINVDKSGEKFKATLNDGSVVHAKRIVLAYGIADVLPDIPGFKENWGHLIYHCPFCHGYEAKGQKLAYFAQGPMFFHALPLVRSLTEDLIFLTNADIELTA
ncbi:MAG: NAD(P)/FAD-dependent oxidoreductase, partial [Proteobacteria bacterium]